MLVEEYVRPYIAKQFFTYAYPVTMHLNLRP